MATQIATPAPKPNDDIPTMMRKIHARIGRVVDVSQQGLMWADAQQFEKEGNRDALVKLFGRIGQYIGRYQRYLTATEPVRVAWQGALDAWTKWVQAENAKGHKGQEAMCRAQILDERPAYCVYAQAEARISNLWPDGECDIEPLLADLEKLTFAISNYAPAGWCHCGTPVEMITPKGEGKKAFLPKLCKVCYTTEPEPKVAPKKASAPKKPAAPQQNPEALKAAKRARHEAKQAKLNDEMRELQGLHPGQYQDGKAKKAKDAAKENRKQGGDPDREKGKKKGGKKKGSGAKSE